MAFRFQTRLSLAMGAILVSALVLVTLLFVWPMMRIVHELYREMGRTTTQLAKRNIEYGVTVPNRVLDRVGEQMVLSALLTAELVAVAENGAGMEPDEISAVLRRVVDRASETGKDAIAEEFWVTDGSGRIYIGSHSEPLGFAFSPDEEGHPQSHEFHRLLTPGAKPVIQPLQRRDYDGKRVKFVGVSGVDKPRIVQVGVGEELIQGIETEFSVQNIVDRFYGDLRVAQMIVMDSGGKVIAAECCEAAHAGTAPPPEVAAFCRSFLRESGREHEVAFFDRDVGIVTRLDAPGPGDPLALFIRYRTDATFRILSHWVWYVALLSGATIVLAVFVIMLMSRGISRPIQELVEGVRQIGDGNLSHRVRIETGDEIHDLAEAFNGMAVSLRDRIDELREETQRRERLESELAIAAQVQRSLLPEKPPAVPGLELAGWSRSAREVGGDFYDFLEMGPDLLGIAIGDATGKGLPAALLITECSSVLKALAEETRSPGALLARTNAALCRQLEGSGQFITLFFMVVNTRTGAVTYSRAGHNPPLLLGANLGREAWLGEGMGLPLGVKRDCRFEDVEVQLDPADTVLLYSDGITEARRNGNDLYGEERMQSVLEGCIGCPLGEVLTHLHEDVAAHVGGKELSDDMTMVGLRFAPVP